MNNVDSKLVGKIFDEYKKLYLAIKYSKPQRLGFLLRYCMQLVPIVMSIKGYRYGVPKQYIKECLRRKLREVIRRLYPNRIEFVKMIIEFLQKVIKEKGLERSRAMAEKGRKKLARSRLEFNLQPVHIDNRWLDEVREEVLESLRFDGEQRYYAEQLLDVILHHGESAAAPKYIRDIVFFLLRRAIIKRFGYHPQKIFNPRLQVICNVLWKS